jgi:predicted heme/steroid binding protein
MHLLRITAAAALLAAATAARANAFLPGEETVFQVRFLNLPTGEGRIVVGEPQGDIWPVVFQAKTEGVAGFIDIREHLVSYWDAAARLPRGMDLRAYEVGDFHVDTARFDRVNQKATISSTFNGRRTEKTFAVPADVHDLTSAFMWLRLQNLEPGQRYDIPVVASSKQFTVVAEVLGRESVETPAGTFPTVKVKIRTALDGKFSTKRDSYMWLSDDGRHILVRASADFAVGSIVATLKSYRPGSPLAAR